MASIEELWETLTTSGAAPLIAKEIDPLLLNKVRQDDPWETALPVKTWSTNEYYFDSSSAFPYAQHVVEAPPTAGAGSVTPTQSAYGQTSFPIKHYQTNGDLSKFANKVAHVALDAASLLAMEMQRSAQAMRWLRTVTSLYGCAAGTPDVNQNNGVGTWRPQWDGIDRQIDTANVILGLNGIAGTLQLHDLDNLIDIVTENVAGEAPDSDFFLAMDRRMISQLNRLVNTNGRQFTPTKLAPRRDDGTVGSPVVEVEGGIEVVSYRGVPIIPTSFVRPGQLLKSGSQVGTVTAAAAGTGGTLGTAALFYQIVAITQYGPLYASAEATVTPSAGNKVTLSFATPQPTDNYGNVIPVIQYQVYKSGTSGKESLYGVVGGFDGVDAAVTSIVDDGASLSAGGANGYKGAFFGTGTNATEGDGASFCSVPVTGKTAASIYMVSRNPDFVVVPTVTDMESEVLAPTNYRTIQYAVGGDCTLAMRASAFAAKLQLVSAS